MQTGDIPPEVARFIGVHIDTVSQLEALLLLCETAPKAWTASELAARVYVDLATAQRIVQDLSRRGLIGADESGTTYRFMADSDAAPLVVQLGDTYRKHLIQVTRMIHAKGSPAMQEFARAFQFKNER